MMETRRPCRTRRRGDAEGRMRKSVSIASMVAALLLAAGPVHAQQRDTVVRMAGTPRHAGVARLVPELTIGVVEGPAEYTFARVTDALTLRDGAVVILDAPNGAAPILRMYDAGGRFRRTIGGVGEGPGEYRSPGGIGQLPDGRILVLDLPQRRINVYSVTGESVDTWQLGGVAPASGGAGLLHTAPDGTVHVNARMMNRDGAAPFERFYSAILRLRTDGTILDTVLPPVLPDVPGSSVSKSFRTSGGSGRSTIGVPYAARALWAWSPLGYMASAVTQRYAVELHPAGSGGTSLISIRRDVRPVPIERAEREAREEWLRAGLDRAQGTLDGPVPDVPRQKPPFTRLQVADDGRIWVQLSTPSERYDPETDESGVMPGGPPGVGIGVSGGGRAGAPPVIRPIPPVPWREPVLYDVFEPDGTYIGQVALPYDTRLVRMRADVVWAVVLNEDGVPIVRRFRLEW